MGCEWNVEYVACSEKAVGGIFLWTSLRCVKHCFLLVGEKKAGIWLFQGLRSDGRKKRRNNSRDRAESVDTGTPAGTLPAVAAFQLLSTIIFTGCLPLPLLPRAFCSFVFILPVPTRLPPTVASDRNPAHAFPSYFNGLFCLLSFSDPSLSFLVFFLTPTFFCLWSQ